MNKQRVERAVLALLNDSPDEARDRLNSLAEISWITKAPEGAPCMKAVGNAAWVSEKERWASFRWSGSDASTVYCGAPAIVNVGFNACIDHGWVEEAIRLEHSIAVAKQFHRVMDEGNRT